MTGEVSASFFCKLLQRLFVVVVLVLTSLGVLLVLFASQVTQILVSLVSVESLIDEPTQRSPLEIMAAVFDNLEPRLRLVGAILLTAGVLGLIFRSAINRFVCSLTRRKHGRHRSATGDLRDPVRVGKWFRIGFLVLVIALGTILRLAFIEQPMRLDEAANYTVFASRPLYIGLSYYPVPNNHLLLTFLMHLSTRIGLSELFVRFPVFLAGLLLIPATYSFARAFYHRNAAMFAAAIIAASSVMIEFSTNARGYVLLTLFFLVSLCAAARALKSLRPLPWLLLIFSLVAGFYTIPTMLYGFVIVMVWLEAVMNFRDKKR